MSENESSRRRMSSPSAWRGVGGKEPLPPPHCVCVVGGDEDRLMDTLGYGTKVRVLIYVAIKILLGVHHIFVSRFRVSTSSPRQITSATAKPFCLPKVAVQELVILLIQEGNTTRFKFKRSLCFVLVAQYELVAGSAACRPYWPYRILPSCQLELNMLRCVGKSRRLFRSAARAAAGAKTERGHAGVPRLASASCGTSSERKTDSERVVQRERVGTKRQRRQANYTTPERKLTTVGWRHRRETAYPTQGWSDGVLRPGES
ncbi:hypothetical protein B0H14DRAFT_3632024 [Mycena olivaceomarginata]|nr:hypothetical protein B0H14DRAFT_3632024 [Mycena olivaceomarginata]